MAMSDDEIEAAHRWAGDKGAEFALKGDRYLPRGGVRHRTRPDFMETSTRVAACGLSASEYSWRGTGSQDEYERLCRIPRCANCIKAESGFVERAMTNQPRPDQLWHQAQDEFSDDPAGRRIRYIELMREHGHLRPTLDGKPRRGDIFGHGGSA